MEESTKTCPICYETLDSNDMLIECKNGHEICSACAQGSAVAELSRFIRGEFQVKCYCKEMLNMEKLMITLNVEDRNKIFSKGLKSSSTTFLKPNEVLMMCNFCNFYAFVCPKDNKWLFFRCQYEKCWKVNKPICTVCSIECDDAQNGRNDIVCTEEASVDFSKNISQTKREWHFRCWKLKELKEEFEETITQGLTNACPQCQYRGTKDEKCCSISCPKCNCNWCYYCEKKDKSNHQLHATCPSDLTQLAFTEPMDSNWPKNPFAATVEYHRQKLLYLLKRKVAEKEACQEQLNNLINHFGKDKVLNGHTLDRIKTFTLSSVFTQRKVKFTE